MQLENLKISRVIMHEVLKRDDDRQPKPPVFGSALEDLEAAAKGAFTLRITEALSTQSKSIEMRISDFAAGSMVDIADRLLDVDEPGFLEISKEIAVRLAGAQKARSIPGGVVIAFDGSFGVPERKFLGVIKAETQSGFRRRRNAEKILTEFLDNIFLTPATRLYKIGFLVQEPKDDGLDWRAIIFDSNISSSHRETAAQYFYEGFFGCLFPENGAYETSRFYDLTKEFVRRGPFTPDKKRDLGDALYTFVKTEQAATFTTHEFADKYLPNEQKDTYKRFMTSKRFPERAVVRDTAQMGARLRRRRFKFGDSIEFSVSPELLHNNEVKIKEAPAVELGGEGTNIWSQITINRAMTDQL
ncbi:nucleoid-associated protein [Rhizobium laguerreae]|uniref:nucleoid-associated protein n=1 Tax=Rhizobium laguerreae TaxID=1076926 RepID=UPI0014418388|nr:nucleoid-associated protein [Rhizobium laguerreae]NKM30778.1 hypothetical protein [Rhizobium laguerreae]